MTSILESIIAKTPTTHHLASLARENQNQIASVAALQKLIALKETKQAEAAKKNG